MKSIVQTVVLAFAALSTAQLSTLSNLPACAKPCAANLPMQCNLGVQCICSDQAFINSISCCISKACSPSDQQQTLQAAQQLCDTVKVQLPSAASCSSSSAAVSGASTASSVSSASAASGASTVSSMSDMSSGSTMAGSTTSAPIATAGSTTGSPTLTTPSTTSAKAASGAAQTLGSKIGAVGAAVAALALL